jgi:hypothetical protein
MIYSISWLSLAAAFAGRASASVIHPLATTGAGGTVARVFLFVVLRDRYIVIIARVIANRFVIVILSATHLASSLAVRLLRLTLH